MMGNFLTYIWDKFSSLFSLFGFGRDETDEGTLTIVKTQNQDEVDFCHHDTRSRNREVLGQSHEKILSKIPREKYAYMVERLSTRHGLSGSLTKQMLQVAENDIYPCGEHTLRDDRYSVTVVKRETDFDVILIEARISCRS